MPAWRCWRRGRDEGGWPDISALLFIMSSPLNFSGLSAIRCCCCCRCQSEDLLTFAKKDHTCVISTAQSLQTARFVSGTLAGEQKI